MELEVGAPKPAARKAAKSVEAPSERRERQLGDDRKLAGALDANPLVDRDRVWGRRAIETEGAIPRLRDALRSSHNRHGESFAGDPEVSAGSALSLEGASALSALTALETLEQKGGAYKEEGSNVAQARDEALQEVYDAEGRGEIGAEQAQVERERIREEWRKEMAALDAVLKRADDRNEIFIQGASGERISGDLEAAGEAGFGRGAMMDLLMADHVAQGVRSPGQTVAVRRAQRARLAQDLDEITEESQALPLAESQQLLSAARTAADQRADALALEADALAAGAADTPEGKALLAAAKRYREESSTAARMEDALRRDREIGLREGLAHLDPNSGVVTFLDPQEAAAQRGREEALVWAKQGRISGDKFLEHLRDAAMQRQAMINELRSAEGCATPALVGQVQEVHSFSEARETELVLARQQKDEAALQMLLAGRRFFDATGNFDKAAETDTAIHGLLRGRAQGADVRTLNAARIEALEGYKKEAIQFVDANLSLLESPGKLPDLEMLRIQASSASGNMGFFEARKALGAIEARDWQDNLTRAGAYCSIMRDSLLFRGVGWGVGMGKGVAEHTAAGMYALLNSAGQIALMQGTQLSKAMATGQDTGVGVQMAMGSISAAGDSFAKAWGLLLLTKTLRAERKRNQMERLNQKRANFENREKDIDKIVQRRSNGVTMASVYMDMTRRFRDSVQAVAMADGPQREAAKQKALSCLQDLRINLDNQKLDHQQNFKFISEHPELSPKALERSAAESLGKLGLYSEAAAFDERIAQRHLQSGRLGDTNVYHAVDAWKRMLAIAQSTPDPGRPEPMVYRELRSLNERHYGSHGDLAPGMFVMNTKEGPVGVMFNCNQPPGVALAPLELDTEGRVQGFKEGVMEFDLLDLGGEDGKEALLKGKDPQYHVRVLNESWHGFADACGLNAVQSEAIRGYLQAAQLRGPMPFSMTSRESQSHLANLRQAGILVPPVEGRPDSEIIPVSAATQSYWDEYFGQAGNKASQQAVVVRLAQAGMENTIAAQTFVQAARSRVELYQTLQRERQG